MAAADAGKAAGAPDGETFPLYGRLEKACEMVCELALVAMVALIGAESLARSIFHVALESADEFGGYLLVAVSFISLSTCQVTGALHHLELVQVRLSPVGRAISALVFDLFSLAFSAVLLWQLTRVAWNSWTNGEIAQTGWLTPLWIPMLSMPLGAAALAATLVKVLAADARMLQAARKAR